MWPTRDPGAMPVTSATASSWAGVPYRRAPDGPTQTAIGSGAAAMRSSSASISSRPTTAPRGVHLQHQGLGAVRRRTRSMASSMASTTIGSNSPLTWSTSTGPDAGVRLVLGARRRAAADGEQAERRPRR